MVVALAIIDGDAHNFILVSRSSTTNGIELNHVGWESSGDPVEYARIDADGLFKDKLTVAEFETLELTPHPVNFFSVISSTD